MVATRCPAHSVHALAVALAILAGMPARAVADKPSSIRYYERGKRHYERGDYPQALKSFLRAYDEHPAPEYLYNIAQTHRMLGHCRESLDYYQRFLAEQPAESARKIAENHVATLEQQCGEPEPKPSSPEPSSPSEPVRPAPAEGAIADTAAPAPAETRAATTASVDASKPEAPPGSVSLALGRPFAVAEAGVALYDMGAVDAPAVAALRLGIGYPVSLGAIELEGSASIELSPMSYRDAAEGRVTLGTIMIGGGARYEFAPRWRGRAAVGLGDAMMFGLDTGNPFTEDRMSAGVQHMLSVRGELGASYALNDRLHILASPLVLTYCARSGDLADDVGSVVRYAFLAGAAYSL